MLPHLEVEGVAETVTHDIKALALGRSLGNVELHHLLSKLLDRSRFLVLDFLVHGFAEAGRRDPENNLISL